MELQEKTEEAAAWRIFQQKRFEKMDQNKRKKTTKKNKFKMHEDVFIIDTKEKGIVVDIYQSNGKWYYQIELYNKTEERDVIQVEETNLTKKVN